jgi:hypothetical protein
MRYAIVIENAGGNIPPTCRIFQVALRPERLLPLLSRLFARP